MQIRQLFNDDDAVSPVIGVILMVAITVILAAVIATFVLGLGESVSQTAPTASFNTDFSENENASAGNVTFSHSNGDTIPADALFVRGQNGSSGAVNARWLNISNSSRNLAFTDSPHSGSNSSEIASQPAVAAGDFIRFRAASDAELRLIFNGRDSDQSSTLARFEGPDA